MCCRRECLWLRAGVLMVVRAAAAVVDEGDVRLFLAPAAARHLGAQLSPALNGGSEALLVRARH